MAVTLTKYERAYRVSTVFVRVCVFGFGWTVVRFVRVIRLPACARVSRVSRVCPGSPRCLFTG